MVIGPDEFGEASCNVLNTSYSGSELRFAMAPERMRVAPSPSETADEQPAFASLPAAPAVSVTLAEIGESYRVNTVAARQRFEGRSVTLAATLQNVGSDYIRLTDGPFGIAVCNFDEARRSELASLAPGARLTVQGDDAWWGWDTFQLKSCRVLDEQAAQPALVQDQGVPTNGRPPLGRYVCRQYMTTIGYIHLGSDSYVVSGTSGSYNFDDGNGAVTWNGGAYAGWPAKYEFSPAGAGHAHDEHIIRMTDDTGRLTIDCFLMAD
ncbi:MAG: hypothetical protein ACU0BO_14130 [Limimaricola soesokkakensis]|uniref:hypothetical protein n=1 Tax=Limimaricola soesokkakensis TaxID=1343159 RepID=UPI00405A0689